MASISAVAVVAAAVAVLVYVYVVKRKPAMGQLPGATFVEGTDTAVYDNRLPHQAVTGQLVHPDGAVEVGSGPGAAATVQGGTIHGVKI